MSARKAPARALSAGVSSSGTRRTAAELDSLIHKAAREVFAERGFAATTTREIAARAGVHEPALYRRHGTKEGLFRAAVLEPFSNVISSYLELWETQVEEPASLRELVTAFVGPLYSLLREHSELALAMVQARDISRHSDGADPWPDEVGRLLDRLVPQLEVEAGRRGLRVDASTTNVVVLGMALGVALLDPVLPSAGGGTTPDKVSTAMIDLILQGVSPVAEPLAPGSSDPVTSELLLALHQRVVDAERRAAVAEQALSALSQP